MTRCYRGRSRRCSGSTEIAQAAFLRYGSFHTRTSRVILVRDDNKTLYRFKTRRSGFDLRFDPTGCCGQDRGLCPFASST
jgi:hypothetical protein